MLKSFTDAGEELEENMELGSSGSGISAGADNEALAESCVQAMDA